MRCDTNVLLNSPSRRDSCDMSMSNRQNQESYILCIKRSRNASSFYKLLYLVPRINVPGYRFKQSELPVDRSFLHQLPYHVQVIIPTGIPLLDFCETSDSIMFSQLECLVIITNVCSSVIVPKRPVCSATIYSLHTFVNKPDPNDLAFPFAPQPFIS